MAAQLSDVDDDCLDTLPAEPLRYCFCGTGRAFGRYAVPHSSGALCAGVCALWSYGLFVEPLAYVFFIFPSCYFDFSVGGFFRVSSVVVVLDLGCAHGLGACACFGLCQCDSLVAGGQICR